MGFAGLSHRSAKGFRPARHHAGEPRVRGDLAYHAFLDLKVTEKMYRSAVEAAPGVQPGKQAWLAGSPATPSSSLRRWRCRTHQPRSALRVAAA